MWTVEGRGRPVDDAARRRGPTGVAPAVIVTGFGAFPGQEVNPTLALVEHLARRPGVLAQVLPVSFARAPASALALAEAHPDLPVVAFGVAATAVGFRVERQARNRDGAAVADVDGELRRGQPIDLTAPDALPTRLPVEAMIGALEAAGLPVEESDDAGGYVCNHLLWNLLDGLAPSRTTGFVHAPDPATGAVSLDEVLRAGEVLLDVLDC